ncbi:sensor histidine kinase [Nocardia stercoris]|uniref:histidine kinase n=1 Tax=Nocardia stercoris TaxID=2483361 RepID=A0A3M2KTG5_9NOCA|nr:histidine kinase [Nocardia stercoris]RMI28391.1 sensor histidine kinase [Nocardia stercoris]
MGIREGGAVPQVEERLSGRTAERFRHVPGWMVDAAVTVLVTVATVGPQIADGRAPWVIGLALTASVPLLWRRRAPLPTLCVVGTGITALACVHALPALPYSTVVCAYTIAAYSGAVVRLIAAVTGVLGIIASLVVPGEPIQSYGYAALSFLTAWTLGTGVRARHTQIELLRERARRIDEERVAAVARERVLIARDVHDIVTHALGLMIVQAETGPLLTGSDPDRANAVFAGIADTGRAAVHELRLSLAAMRNGRDDACHQPGIAAIPDLVDMCGRSGVSATFQETGGRRAVSGEVDVAAYRVVQQALTNTLEHARAEHVDVELRWSATTLTVRVSDDGRGRHDTARRGSGLIGMRERVESCGGVLRDNGSGPGFALVAELPIARGL